MADAISPSQSAVYGECNISTGSTWQQLTSTPVKCQRVILSAPTALNTCGKVNSENILIKLGLYNQSAGTYTAPSNQSGGFTLQPTQNGLTYEIVSSPALLWVYGTQGDCVEWSAEL